MRPIVAILLIVIAATIADTKPVPDKSKQKNIDLLAGFTFHKGDDVNVIKVFKAGSSDPADAEEIDALIRKFNRLEGK